MFFRIDQAYRGVVYGAREAHNLPGQVRPLAPQHYLGVFMPSSQTNHANNYPLFEVSCKCILTNPDHTKILLVGYDDGLYSLPGGHLEIGETPLQAAQRELAEELGLHDITDLHPAQFFYHQTKHKVILTFLGTISDATPLPPTPVNEERLVGSKWIALDDFRADNEGKYCDTEYRAMIEAVLTT